MFDRLFETVDENRHLSVTKISRTFRAMKARRSEIGRNIKILRGSLSQEDLAEQMRHRGYDTWSQSAVWAVESGKRALPIDEAEALAQVLGVPLDILLATEFDAVVRALVAQLEGAAQQVVARALEYEEIHAELVRLVAKARTPTVEAYADEWLERTVDTLIESGRVDVQYREEA